MGKALEDIESRALQNHYDVFYPRIQDVENADNPRSSASADSCKKTTSSTTRKRNSFRVSLSKVINFRAVHLV